MDLSITPIKADVFKFLERTSDTFDIIFADPPYNFKEDKFLTIAHLVFERQLLLEDGLLVIEHSDKTNLSHHPNFSDSRKYGGSVFSFFEA